MAPPGVNNCFDYLDTSTFSSYFSPASTTLKAMSFSSLLSPRTDSLPGVSTCATHADHDYVVKSQLNCEGCGGGNLMVDLPGDYDGSGCGDAMLSSCALEMEKGAGEESTDTDFLKDLDDLNFSFDDLNPCSEVAMEDSFQDFIDSALEQSYSTCLHDVSEDNETPSHRQDAVILNKEQFLGILELRPNQDSISHNVLSPSSVVIGTESCADSTTCSSDGLILEIAESSAPKFYSKDVNCNEQVPTRQCSCLGFESEFKAVYSIAHSINQENVRTCSSTSTLTKKGDCTECTHTGITSEVRMSPLFVDTASGGISGSFQSSSRDSVDVVMEVDTVQRADRDTADIMTWLNDSQQEFQQQYGDNNNNINEVQSHELSAGTELFNQNMIIAPPLDLESFVDLEDFEAEAPGKEIHTLTHLSCQKPVDLLTYVSNSSCISQLKLSVFTERVDDGGKLVQNYCSHIYPESSISELLSPNSSYISHNDFSPTLSTSDSTNSPFSPQPLRSVDLSLSSHYDYTVYDNAVKSPLALLNLFSDENATSLLHADSAVPSIRFM